MAIAIEQEGSISISSQGLYMLLKNIWFNKKYI
jgi:hypothetical protein